jgi:hypothetical protein
MNRLSLADLTIFATLMNVLSSWSDEERLQFSNITRWYDNIQHLPELFDSLQKENSLIFIKRNIPKSSSTGFYLFIFVHFLVVLSFDFLIFFQFEGKNFRLLKLFF